jgi:hypothetical protein
MLFFFSLIIAATAVVGAFAAPTELVRRQDPIRYVTFIETGTHDGYYYSFWTDGRADVQLTLGPGGSYSVNWSTPEGGSGVGSWIAGKGWERGSSSRYGPPSPICTYLSIRDNQDVDHSTGQAHLVHRYLSTQWIQLPWCLWMGL